MKKSPPSNWLWGEQMAFLKSIEWGTRYRDGAYGCPVCSAGKWLGHASDCNLKIALAKLDAVGKGKL